MTASDSIGHAAFAHSPNCRVVRATQAIRRSGSTQRNVPLPPKWPNVAGEVSAPDQWPCLFALQLDAETPVHGAEAPEVGQDAVEPRELDGDHLGRGSRGRQGPARAAHAPSARTSSTERVHACAGMSRRVEGESEWLADGGAHVVRERHLRPGRDVCPEHTEPLVRVDATAAGRCDRSRAVKGQPGSVREQVAHRRARRSCRLVEIDHSLLRSDERRECADRLRDRREADGVTRVAAGRERRRRARHPAAANGTSQESIWRRASTFDQRYYRGDGAPPDLGTLAVRAGRRLFTRRRRRLDRSRRRHRADRARRLSDSGRRLRTGASLPLDHRRSARRGWRERRGRRPDAAVHHRRGRLRGRRACPRRGLRRRSGPPRPAS